ncbi:MAG: oligosaccharide flippase family protein [Chloroflexota bacterium]
MTSYRDFKKRALKPADTLGEVFLNDPISTPMAYWLARIPQLDPLHITAAAFLCRAVAAFAFGSSELVVGAGLALAGFLLDGVDGKVSRFRYGKDPEWRGTSDFLLDQVGLALMAIGLFIAFRDDASVLPSLAVVVWLALSYVQLALTSTRLRLIAQAGGPAASRLAMKNQVSRFGLQALAGIRERMSVQLARFRLLPDVGTVEAEVLVFVAAPLLGSPGLILLALVPLAVGSGQVLMSVALLTRHFDATAPAENRSTNGSSSWSIRSMSWGLLDQLLVSASSFLTAVLLARVLDPHEFGVFALGYALLLLGWDVQSALVTQPHNVLSSRQPDYRAYTSTALIIQTAVIGISALLTVGAAEVLGLDTADGTNIALVLGLVVVAFQGQEFVRRVLYSELRLKATFINDVFSYGGQVLLIALIAAIAPSAAGGIAAIGISSTVGILLAVYQLRRSFAGRIDPSAFRLHWTFGRWLLAGATATWIGTQSYLFLVAILLGSAEAGVLKAVEIPMRPLNVILTLLDSVLLVRFGRFDTIRTLRSLVGYFYRLTTPVAVLYCLGVSLLAKPILDFLYDSDLYTAQTGVLALLALYYLLRYGGHILAIALRALGLTRASFEGALVGAIVTPLVAVPMIIAFGLPGAAIGLVVSMALTDLVRIGWYRDHVQTELPAAAVKV